MYCNGILSAIRIKDDKWGVCCTRLGYDMKDIDNWYDLEKDNIERVLSGNYDYDCKYCTSRIKFGSSKLGDEFHKNVLRYFNGEQNKIFFLDAFLGNNCNNNCKTCSPWNNRDIYLPNVSYARDVSALGTKIDINDNTFKFLEERGSDLIYLDLIGGEPLLYPNEIFKLLELCPKLESVRFTTNGSIYNQEIFDELERRNIKVSFSISIDGTPFSQKYIRGYSNYDNVLENIKKFQKVKNSNVCINVTVSIFNILDLEEIVNTLNDRLGLDHQFSFCLVYDPDYYSILSITDIDLQNKISNIINSLEKIDNILKPTLKSLKNFFEENKGQKSQTNNKEILSLIEYHDKKLGLYSNDFEYIHRDMYDYLIKEQE